MTKKAKDLIQWYQFKPNHDRLELWARSKAPGRITALVFDVKPDTTGWFDPQSRRIGVNPTSVGKTPAGQWRGSRAIIAHECGHANHTGNLGQGLLHYVANALEDQRVEWLACNADAGVLSDMRFKNKWRWTYADALDPASDDAQEVLGAALFHRWEWWLAGLNGKNAQRIQKASQGISGRLKSSNAHKNNDVRKTKITLSPTNQTRWETVRPWVEEAWHATTSDEVVASAKKIIEFLGLEPNMPLSGTFSQIAIIDCLSHGTGDPQGAEPDMPIWSNDNSSAGEDDPLPPGDGPHSPGSGWNSNVDPSELNPQYAEYVTAAESLARRLVARLIRPTPNSGREPNETRGRYSLRAELHNPDKPFLAWTATAPAPGLAVEIIGDRSGSMGTVDPNLGVRDTSDMNCVRIGAMALHLACCEVEIPHAITLFDGMFSILDYEGDKELARALLAGWQGMTGTCELVTTIKQRAPRLLARKEGTKLMVVMHDGAPAAFDRAVTELTAFYRQTAGKLYVVGVYLTSDETNTAEIDPLQQLFPHLIVTTPQEFPDKLGDLLDMLHAG